MKSSALFVVAERDIGAHVVDQERDGVRVALFGGVHERSAREAIAGIGQLDTVLVACAQNRTQAVDVVGVGGRVNGRALVDRVVRVASTLGVPQQPLHTRQLALVACQIEGRATVRLSQLEQAWIRAQQHL